MQDRSTFGPNVSRAAGFHETEENSSIEESRPLLGRSGNHVTASESEIQNQLHRRSAGLPPRQLTSQRSIRTIEEEAAHLDQLSNLDLFHPVPARMGRPRILPDFNITDRDTENQPRARPINAL